MTIDFGPVWAQEKKFSELATEVSKADLVAATNESIEALLGLLNGLTDADVVFDPHDPEAKDPYAADDEQEMGWSLAHLIAHVTASSEEGAAFSSVLARGHGLTERPRYETPWRDLTTHANCVQRVEESRRMRLAYLETWPDEPFMEVYRGGMSEGFEAWTGKLNAIGCFLLGLGHEVNHFSQLDDVKQQAVAARNSGG